IIVRIKERDGRELNIRLRKLLVRLETLLLCSTRQKVAQLRANHRRRPARRRRSEEDINDRVRLAVNRYQHLSFKLICSDERHLFSLRSKFQVSSFKSLGLSP